MKCLDLDFQFCYFVGVLLEEGAESVENNTEEEVAIGKAETGCEFEFPEGKEKDESDREID